MVLLECKLERVSPLLNSINALISSLVRGKKKYPQCPLGPSVIHPTMLSPCVVILCHSATRFPPRPPALPASSLLSQLHRAVHLGALYSLTTQPRALFSLMPPGSLFTLSLPAGHPVPLQVTTLPPSPLPPKLLLLCFVFL